jgi:hypothetical protein
LETGPIFFPTESRFRAMCNPPYSLNVKKEKVWKNSNSSSTSRKCLKGRAVSIEVVELMVQPVSLVDLIYSTFF